MPAIAAIHATPAAIIIKIDIRSCEFSASAPMGKKVSLPDGSVAININYFWKGKPIGKIVNHGKEVPSIPLDRPRAVLIIKDKKAHIHLMDDATTDAHLKHGNWKDAVVIQAGPWVIHKGKLFTNQEIARERFSSPVFRRTNHTLIGIDKEGKLLLEFIRGRTVREAAMVLQRVGAIEAMNLDGGSSSYLSFSHCHYGSSPRTLLIAKPCH